MAAFEDVWHSLACSEYEYTPRKFGCFLCSWEPAIHGLHRGSAKRRERQCGTRGFQLRPGLDLSNISAVDTIVVLANGQGNVSVSGLAASKCGLMAVLEENNRKLFIYTQQRNGVLEFPLDSPLFSYANQIAFDRHHNIVIAQGDQNSLLRYNMNGKALPNLELPEYINCLTGVVCSPDGDICIVANDPYTIVKQAPGESEWVTLYRSQQDDYDDEVEDEEDSNEFDPMQFSPGQLSFGSDGELFVATNNCINVLSTVDSKLKRQIGCDKYRDGELSKVEDIFAGDGRLPVCV